MRALLTLLTATAALGLADSAGAATVAKVIDGDTVALKDGRKVDLLGVTVPSCYASQARAKLRQLLPARAKVRVQSDPGHPGRYVFRGRTLVNAELIRAGAAQAAATDLKQAAKLTAAETAAKSAARGLWTTCAPAPTPTPTPTPAPPAPDPKQRALADLRGRDFIHITTTTFSSSESHLNLCSDGSYVEDVSTYSDFGGSTSGRYTGRWEVVSATYDATGARATVRRDNDDGTTGWVEFTATATQVTVNGNVVSVQPSSTCT
ncbi:thermonuclease family protein [Solirubrobacter soli]|uniref:thermonuclease family protein n=1 Tax=Solirubrobacter soli TaxID=363832 RepID=UPI000409BBE6|nr:thermonuclease family protein [Solirubrobacter soli]